jgi:hypothetical protein
VSSPGSPPFSGIFTRAEVTYAWPREDGAVSSNREPLALFTGKAVHAYLGHLSDAAIEAMLNEFATELGAALGGTAFMSRSQNGRGFWMPASIAGDTWPGVLATLRSERTSGLRVPRCSQENVWLGRRDILVVPPRCAETLVSS